MLWDFAEPVDAGIFHFDLRIKSLGYGLVDNGLFLFLKQGDLLFLGADQFVDLRRHRIQISHNLCLFVGRGNRET